MILSAVLLFGLQTKLLSPCKIFGFHERVTDRVSCEVRGYIHSVKESSKIQPLQKDGHGVACSSSRVRKATVFSMCFVHENSSKGTRAMCRCQVLFGR